MLTGSALHVGSAAGEHRRSQQLGLYTQTHLGLGLRTANKQLAVHLEQAIALSAFSPLEDGDAKRAPSWETSYTDR